MNTICIHILLYLIIINKNFSKVLLFDISTIAFSPSFKDFIIL